MWKSKATSKTQQVIVNYTEVNIYFNSWTKFSLNNGQPSKCSRQTSKLEKKTTVKRQSYHPIENLKQAYRLPM